MRKNKVIEMPRTLSAVLAEYVGHWILVRVRHWDHQHQPVFVDCLAVAESAKALEREARVAQMDNPENLLIQFAGSVMPDEMIVVR